MRVPEAEAHGQVVPQKASCGVVDVEGGEGGVVDVRVEAVRAVEEPEEEDGDAERRPELHALPRALKRKQQRLDVPELGSHPVPRAHEGLQYAREAAAQA